MSSYGESLNTLSIEEYRFAMLSFNTLSIEEYRRTLLSLISLSGSANRNRHREEHEVPEQGGWPWGEQWGDKGAHAVPT